MSLLLKTSENLDRLRYKYVAYLVIRDAIGFYFGIPKFMKTLDTEAVINYKVAERTKGKDLTERQLEKHSRLVTKSVKARVAYLEDDLEHCREVLFTDNIWMQLLDLDVEFFKSYLDKLPPTITDELAIVPNWTTRDDSLSRPYSTSNKGLKNISF